MITVVVCMTSKLTYEKCLGSSLRKQNVTYKLIKAPTNLSLPASYNSIRPRLNTKYVAFIHQDIRMLENTWLQRAERFCNTIPRLGVAGIAGISWGAKPTGYILHNRSRRHVQYYKKKYKAEVYGSRLGRPALVQTLDSMVLIVPVKVFRRRKFDERITQALGVDYCLSLTYHLKLKNYALPLQSWHTPFRDPKYVRKFQQRKRINKIHARIKHKWRGTFNLIFHTIPIDVCPKCKRIPCVCAKPLNMRQTINYGKGKR